MARKIKTPGGFKRYIYFHETDEKFQVLVREIEKRGLKVGLAGKHDWGYGTSVQDEIYYITLDVFRKKSRIPLMGWKLVFRYKVQLGVKKKLRGPREVKYELVDREEKNLMEEINSDLKRLGYVLFE